MKAKYVQQEILLVTGTQFSSGQLTKSNENESGENLTELERLEEACWNGLLGEMLPEIHLKDVDGGQLFLWQVRQGSSFLELELGTFPENKDRYFSIDPYAFIATKCDN